MNKKIKLVCFVAVVCAWGAVQHSHAADNWPSWRGTNSTGVVKDAEIPTVWSSEENILWRCEMPGQGGSTPAIWGDRLFVTSADGDDFKLICVETKTGKELWSKLVTSGNINARAGEGNSASASPATDGEHVICFFSDGALACFDFDGNKLWAFDVGDRFGKLDIQFGMTSTPVLDGGSVYLQLLHGPMNFKDDTRVGKVIKLDKATGKTVWEIDRETEVIFECKHSYASPFIYRDRKAEFLVVHGADCTTGHDLGTGKEKWRLTGLNGPTELNPKKADPTFRFVSSPGMADGWIVVPTAKRGPTVALQVSEFLQGEVTAGSEAVAWTFEQTPDVSIPVIHDGLVYLLHKDGKLQCIELESGKQIYYERTHSVQHRASPLLVDGKLLLCAKDGVCSVVKAGREFKMLSKNELGREPITASPAVVDNVLFIRTYRALYAIKSE